MTVKRFSGNFYQRDDVLDQITPNNIVQREVSTPAGEWKPANWLPVQFTKSSAMAGEDAFVISSGKVVAQDGEGRIVPAGIRTLLKAGAGALTYTSLDVKWGVTDLVTGVKVTAPVVYSSLDIALALLNRGLVLEQDAIDAGGTIPPTSTIHAAFVIDSWISHAVGVAAYDVYVWSGRPEDGDQHFINYSKQHLVQFYTEVQMQVPHLVAGATAADTFAAATLNTAGTALWATGVQVAAGTYYNATEIAKFTRYSALTAASPVVALGLDPAGTGTQFSIARNTDRTPVASVDPTHMVREVKSPSAIVKAGDWYLDAELGVLFLSSVTWTNMVAAAATLSVSYSYYATAPAAAHRHIHLDGPARPGQFLAYDAQSNFVVATDVQVAAALTIVGRVHAVNRQPRGLLGSVKTAWNHSGVSATAQMPGSATKGFSDLITLSGEVVADQVAIINVRV